MTDAQISKIIGTTKSTINAVRDRSHWNSQSIKPVDPVTLGLCSQIELDDLITKASAKRRKMEAEMGIVDDGPSLAPIDAPSTQEDEEAAAKKRSDSLTAENLFNLDGSDAE